MSTTHYLIVRITEEEETERGVQTPLGRIRNAIHDASQEHDLNVGDMVIRGDRDQDILGEDNTADRNAVRSIYEHSLTRSEERAAQVPQQPRVRTPEERAQAAHQARANRALTTVLNYVIEHPEEFARIAERLADPDKT